MAKNSSRKKIKSVTGILTQFIVYKGSERVGLAFVVYHEHIMGQPVLIADKGGELEPDWYQMVATEQHLVVVNETIQ